MTAYLVRHAKAGDRGDWEGDDRLRPLTKAGKRQAEALAEVLKDRAVEAVLSSPYLRCIQTVEPVAERFGLRVEQERLLAEGAGGDRVLGLVKRYTARSVVFCSHGDVIEDLLQRLIEEGIVPRARAALEKGSTWALEVAGGRVVKATYIPPPG